MSLGKAGSSVRKGWSGQPGGRRNCSAAARKALPVPNPSGPAPPRRNPLPIRRLTDRRRSSVALPCRVWVLLRGTKPLRDVASAKQRPAEPLAGKLAKHSPFFRYFPGSVTVKNGLVDAGPSRYQSCEACQLVKRGKRGEMRRSGWLLAGHTRSGATRSATIAALATTWIGHPLSRPSSIR